MRALYQVQVGGRDVTARLSPVLMNLSVRLSADETGDTCDITLDDTGGKIALPGVGDAVTVALGWQGLQQVFAGVVDEVRSSGTRTGGRTMTITAGGIDTRGKAKQSQRRHWDDATVETILKDAAKTAGIGTVRVDPQLAGIVRPYFAMLDESFMDMGRRLAAEIGGHFRAQGGEAIMARRGGAYAAGISAAWGTTLHSWDLAPLVSRRVYGTIRATWYDAAAAQWKNVDVDTGLDSEAMLTLRPPAEDEADAKRKAEAAKATSARDSGLGSVRIEGNPAAVPDALCRLSGARPGIDGAYRIVGVTHGLSRSGGFVTDLELAQPQEGAGTDTR